MTHQVSTNTKLGLIGMVLLTLVLTACANGPSSETPPISDSPTVYLRDMAFEASHVTIEAGDTVTWIWDDGDIDHDVSGDGFKSEIQSEGEYSFTFDTPGTYDYICTLHPMMKGRVSVVEATS